MASKQIIVLRTAEALKAIEAELGIDATKAKAVRDSDARMVMRLEAIKETLVPTVASEPEPEPKPEPVKASAKAPVKKAPAKKGK